MAEKTGNKSTSTAVAHQPFDIIPRPESDGEGSKRTSPCRPKETKVSKVRKTRRTKRRAGRIAWEAELVTHEHVRRKWVTLAEDGNGAHCNLCDIELVVHRKYDGKLTEKHLNCIRHRERVQTRKHKEVAKEREREQRREKLHSILRHPHHPSTKSKEAY